MSRLLVLALLVGAAAACAPHVPVHPNDTTPSPDTTPAPTEAPTEAPTQAPLVQVVEKKDDASVATEKPAGESEAAVDEKNAEALKNGETPAQAITHLSQEVRLHMRDWAEIGDKFAVAARRLMAVGEGVGHDHGGKLKGSGEGEAPVDVAAEEAFVRKQAARHFVQRHRRSEPQA